ncbi:MAG: polysaccharide deacetylase family protein [Acidobacteria bacterium]|nr:polysaccharide deacetylase family protein [Acidobacteriota bacterium]
MSVPKRALSKLLIPLERAVTAALYPVCRLREILTGTVKVPILMYHQVGPPVDGMPPRRDCVSPRGFERQVRAILDAGYRVVTLSDLIRTLESGALADLRRSVVLTFDDGYRGQFAFAYPVLLRYRLPSTFFVTTGLVGKTAFYPHLAIGTVPARRGASPPLAWLPLSWDEVKEMARHGIGIGSHAVTHRSLGRLAGEVSGLEVWLSKESLERRAGIRVDLFAYPFGSQANGDFDRLLQDVLRRSGFRGACTRVIGRCGRGADPLALPRIPMEEGDGPFRVRCKLAGAYDWVGPFESLWQRLTERDERADAMLPLDVNPALRIRR